MTLLPLIIIPSPIPCKRVPAVSRDPGAGGRGHSPDEFLTEEGLREVEKWVVPFSHGDYYLNLEMLLS